MPGFDDALKLILQFEGGYVCDPMDPGGATNKGITQGTYTSYLKAHDLGDRDVKFIGNDEVATIYRENYWQALLCDQMPYPIALAAFDCAVNSGVAKAAKLLQAALWVKDDGVIGVGTLTAAKRLDPVTVARSLLTLRRQFLMTLVSVKPSSLKFLDGWLRRIDLLWGEVRGTIPT